MKKISLSLLVLSSLIGLDSVNATETAGQAAYGNLPVAAKNTGTFIVKVVPMVAEKDTQPILAQPVALVADYRINFDDFMILLKANRLIGPNGYASLNKDGGDAIAIKTWDYARKIIQDGKPVYIFEGAMTK